MEELQDKVVEAYLALDNLRITTSKMTTKDNEYNVNYWTQRIFADIARIETELTK